MGPTIDISTTTSTAIHEFVLSVLIIISDIVYKWIPAAFAVLSFGHVQIVPPETPYNVAGGPSSTEVINTAAQSVQGGVNAASNATSGALDATQITASGLSQQLPSVSFGSGGTAASGMGSAAGNTSPDVAAQTVSTAGGILHTAWSIFAPLSIFISLLLAVGLVYALIRLLQVRFAEAAALKALAVPNAAPAVAAATVAAPTVAGIPLPVDVPKQEPAVSPVIAAIRKRWSTIESQVTSEEENDWRLAILEADIMLNDVLEAHGYMGDTIGDKLKSARSRADFKTLDQAWDAHIVRNHIAHRGSQHDINQREAKRVIHEYKQVFTEFGVL